MTENKKSNLHIDKNKEVDLDVLMKDLPNSEEIDKILNGIEKVDLDAIVKDLLKPEEIAHLIEDYEKKYPKRKNRSYHVSKRVLEQRKIAAKRPRRKKMNSNYEMLILTLIVFVKNCHGLFDKFLHKLLQIQKESYKANAG